jgi:hypothetical protein
MTPLILINFLFLSYSSTGTFKDMGQPLNKGSYTNIYSDSIPDWVRHVYEKNNNEFLNEAIPVVTFFKKISDSVSYCLFQVEDGVCQITFIATQKNKKKYKRFKIGSQCDEDFANPIYSTTTYEHNTISNSITLTTDIEKAQPKYLIKTNSRGVFKNGYNMENTRTIKYSIIKALLIDKSGNIIVKGIKSH